MSFIQLCLILCLLKTTGADHHTLKYLYTLRPAPEDDPEFEMTAVFDDLIISHCQSPSFRDQTRYVWINEAFTAEEWKIRDRFCEHEYYLHKPLKEGIQQSNINNGIIQRERSCTEDDSAVYMSDRWGVNGEDFLTLDPNTLKWRSESLLANTIQSDWNQMKFMIPSLRDFEQSICKPSLLKLKKKKEDYLKQNMCADVYVFAKASQHRDTVYLRCYVSHKYLSGIRVRLTLDGLVLSENVNVASPAPNMDGTVQIRLQTETSTKEPDRYHCVVDSDGVHIAVVWDGEILEKGSAVQKCCSNEFEKHVFSGLLNVLLSCGTIICILICGVYKCYKKVKTSRNVNMNKEVQHFFNYCPPEEEWRKEAEADDEFYCPTRRPRVNHQDITAQSLQSV